MRTIKFRGKRLDGEWVYGDLLHDRGLGGDVISDVVWIRTAHSQSYQALPESVGQWTGLVDRHGKEIFEGDIVTTDITRPYLIVEFRNGCFVFNCNDGGEDYYDIMFPIAEEPHDTYKYGEIIGNIIDSPELMEVE